MGTAVSSYIHSELVVPNMPQSIAAQEAPAVLGWCSLHPHVYRNTDQIFHWLQPLPQTVLNYLCQPLVLDTSRRGSEYFAVGCKVVTQWHLWSLLQK